MMSRTVPLGRTAESGVTLVELMVALVIGMLLALAVMLLQKNLALQKTRGSDVALRDNETRAAMDLITHDLGGAGFLLGGNDLRCDELFTYNSSPNAGYYAHMPVDAFTATAGAVTPFAPTLTLNYPAAGIGIPSQVLVISGAIDATGFGNAPTGPAPSVPLFQNATYDPVGAGVLPVTNINGLTTGHVGVLQVPNLALGIALSGAAYPNRPVPSACVRLPISAVNAANRTVTSSPGKLMPGSFIAGFSANLMLANAFTTGLSDQMIYNGAWLVDLGATTPTNPSPTQRTTVYYIDNTNPWPTLMKAQYSLLDDAQVALPQQVAVAAQPIAAGVVSLRVLFGVDPGSTGAVTGYETAAAVKANLHQHVVLTVQVQLITRSLYPDPDVQQGAVNTVVPAAGSFPAMAIPAAYQKYRFTSQVTEVGLRDLTWTP